MIYHLDLMISLSYFQPTAFKFMIYLFFPFCRNNRFREIKADHKLKPSRQAQKMAFVKFALLACVSGGFEFVIYLPRISVIARVFGQTL